MGLGGPKILYEKCIYLVLDQDWTQFGVLQIHAFMTQTVFPSPGPHILLDPLEQTSPCVLTGLQPYQFFDDLALLPGIGSGW